MESRPGGVCCSKRCRDDLETKVFWNEAPIGLIMKEKDEDQSLEGKNEG